MAKEKEPVFLFVGVYEDPATAEDDLELVRELHETKVIGTYDAGIATKDAEGDVKVKRMGSKHAGWTGIGAGAVVGLLFPPSIIAMAALGGATGGIIGHFSRALSRSDVKELGEMLDMGQAALIVIGKDKISAELEKAGLKATKRTEKQLDVDAGDLELQLAAAAGEAGAA
ncbi:DUF1269 domain-containing protein [Leifsonia sp. YAF41]|uniref:DUF1269 domain-containing protein n=1 Tax=Leifsonia sp. YAF41 TaxID=3233086 RepID=UPI003F9D21DE